MSGSCKHPKQCGLSWLRLLYIFLCKIYFKKTKQKTFSPRARMGPTAPQHALKS